jgi:hypothetical protein
MILYRLNCKNGHQFEAWFRDSGSFDEQKASGVIECPFCGDRRVAKAPMAPSLAGRRGGNERAEVRAKEVAEQILQAVNTIRDSVEKNCDYVGDKFASEAKRIHYGEVEGRGIYGEASEEDAVDLAEEGVEFSRIPWLSRRDN